MAARAASASTPAPAETGETAAVVNTVKAIFGAGGFSLPWAFAQGGVALVSACLLASYVFALEALKMLVRAQDTLIDNGVVSGYEEVQTYAGLTGAALGPAGDVLCKALNVITCFGILRGVHHLRLGHAHPMFPAATQLTFSTARMIITSLPLWVALSWQRSFKGVNLISLMGTVSVALGMSWVTVVALANPALAANFAAIPMSNPAAFSGFFGTVAFLFFIHFTLFGVQEAMPDRRRFVPAVSKAFGLSMVISAAFGLIGAWGFGPGVKSVVITMLDGAAGTAVKALLCVNLLFTFPLMARSCLNICEQTVAGGKDPNLVTSLGTRTAFVTSAAFLACVVPNFRDRPGVRRRVLLLRHDARDAPRDPIEGHDFGGKARGGVREDQNRRRVRRRPRVHGALGGAVTTREARIREGNETRAFVQRKRYRYKVAR